MLDRLFRFLNWFLLIPLFGLGGTFYFNHLGSYGSTLARMGYDAQRRTLDVHFTRSRALWRYHDVTSWDVLKLLTADSLGREFNRRIIGQKAAQQLTWYPKSVRKNRRSKAIKKALKRAPKAFPKGDPA